MKDMQLKAEILDEAKLFVPFLIIGLAIPVIIGVTLVIAVKKNRVAKNK